RSGGCERSCDKLDGSTVPLRVRQCRPDDAHSVLTATCEQGIERLEIVDEKLSMERLPAPWTDETIEPRQQSLLRLEGSTTSALELHEPTEVWREPTRESDHDRSSGHSTAASRRRG